MRFWRSFPWSFVALAGLAPFLAPIRAVAADEPGLFHLESPVRAIRYTFPGSEWPNTLPPLCALARDLPLTKESGANTVYTRGAPPEDGDHIFLSLLASTRLNWVAAYPLPEDVDPDRSLLEQREAILTRFADFAQRFRGNRNLKAVVLDFGAQHLVESALLAPEFAAILSEQFPENTPLLGHVAYEPDTLYITPAGVKFWLYRFTGTPPSASNRDTLTQRTTLPILFDVSAMADRFLPDGEELWKGFLAALTAGSNKTHLLAIDLVGDREIVSATTTASDGGSVTTTNVTRYRNDALFIGVRDSDGFESYRPTVFAPALRDFWGAAPLEDHAAPPVLDPLLNAATKTPYVSPGTQVTFTGSLLTGEDKAVDSAEDWPLHAGAKCLCVGDRPIPLGGLLAGEGSAQLPWLMDPGMVAARFVREGVVSTPVLVDILEVSPGIFPLRVERTDAGCNAMESDGVVPGETIEIEATGAGPLNGDLRGMEVLLNDTPAELLYAGLESDSVGLARMRVKLPDAVIPSERKGLFLRQGNRASNIIPISFVGDARATVGLVAERERILVQPGGLSAPLRVDTQGLNGYCGRIEFSVEGLPTGLSATIYPVNAGKPATLVLRADSSAKVREDQAIYLYALPTPGDIAILSLKLRVMPQVGEMAVKLESRGYAAGASASITWNGEILPPTGPKAARGLYVQLIDPRTGVFSPIEHYDPWESAEESTRLEVRLNSLRAGTLVAMAVADDATLHMQASLRSWIQTKLGSASIATLGYQHSWAIIGKVGAKQPIAESTSENEPAVAEAVLVLPEK